VKKIAADGLIESLFEADESANAHAFLQLCRQWRGLTDWLLNDFVRDPAVREKFSQVVAGKIPPPTNGLRWIAEMNGDDRAYREIALQLRQQVFPRGLGIYGGLTRQEMAKLIRKHQSGTLDLGAFLLAQQWREAGDKALSSFRLKHSAAAFVDAVVRTGRPRLLRHFAKALRHVKEYENKTKRRALLGYDWWKLHVLFYIWRHPRESYRTRDLRAHLATLGVKVTTKAMRRFCKRHGIRRDERAGRPRTETVEPEKILPRKLSKRVRNDER
jgi:hypothetical protein